MLFVNEDRYYSADRPTENHVRNLERGRGEFVTVTLLKKLLSRLSVILGVGSPHTGLSSNSQVAVVPVAVAIDQHLRLHVQARAPVSACLCVRFCV